MHTTNSAQRSAFEKEAMPHLGVLWRTAVWLTMRSGIAEDLVLKTTSRAYCSWPDSVGTVGCRVWLLRIMAEEFFGALDRKDQSGWFLSESHKALVDTTDGDHSYTDASIDPRGLQVLSGMSGESVKGAIARLDPQSRFIILLLMREQLSWGEIAYVTDLPRETVRSIVSRFQRLLPRYLVRRKGRLASSSGSYNATRRHRARFDQTREFKQHHLSSVMTQEFCTNTGADSWENEGGALEGKC